MIKFNSYLSRDTEINNVKDKIKPLLFKILVSKYFNIDYKKVKVNVKTHDFMGRRASSFEDFILSASINIIIPAPSAPLEKLKKEVLNFCARNRVSINKLNIITE